MKLYRLTASKAKTVRIAIVIIQLLILVILSWSSELGSRLVS